MITLTGRVSNRKVFLKFLRLEIVTKKKIRNALYEVGQENIQYVRDLMAEKKHGRIYIIRGIEHQASAPGEAPAIRSGRLARSLFYNVRGHRHVEIGANTRYAGFLEKGTDKMEPRPYLRRAAADNQRNNYNSLVKWFDEYENI